MTEFIYLHGFASGPGSQKACVFKDRFEKARLPLTIPDLQQSDFENLTLTKQVSLVQGIIDGKPGTRFALIGSSMGAYIAALIAETRKEIKALYLMPLVSISSIAGWKTWAGIRTTLIQFKT